MSDYNCDCRARGKLCTRFSNLSRCTPGQVDQLLADMESGRHVETEAMSFGTTRHEMFKEYGEKHGQLPPQFGKRWKPTHIEHEFSTEIWKDIVIHSRVDVACADDHAIVDYKTVIDGVQGYKKIVNSYGTVTKQRQLLFYAYQMGLHGIKIDKGSFFLEVWNEQRDEILYEIVVDFPISLSDMADALNWVKSRVALLAAAKEEMRV